MKFKPLIAGIFTVSYFIAHGDTPLRRVAVAPPTIVAETLPGAREIENDSGLRSDLQREAQAWTIRALRVNRVAGESFSTSLERGGDIELRSEFRLPLAIPANLSGRSAVVRRGRFMSARFTLVDGSGRTTFTEEVSLVWGDGKWLVGTPRYGRSETTEATLKSFLRKASDRAVQRLKRDLIARRGGPPRRTPAPFR